MHFLHNTFLRQLASAGVMAGTMVVSPPLSASEIRLSESIPNTTYAALGANAPVIERQHVELGATYALLDNARAEGSVDIAAAAAAELTRLVRTMGAPRTVREAADRLADGFASQDIDEQAANAALDNIGSFIDSLDEWAQMRISFGAIVATLQSQGLATTDEIRHVCDAVDGVLSRVLNTPLPADMTDAH